MKVRKTYVTKVPDTGGVFLLAGQIIAKHDGSIVRVNYNRAVDLHTFFIEVCAEESHHKEIEEELLENGFMTSDYDDSEIIMIVLRLPMEPGSALPALELLNRRKVYISYVSSQETGDGRMDLKLGIRIDNPEVISGLLSELSQICETRVLDYEVTDRLLDSTVFYVTFAHEMRNILHLSPKDANCVLIRANKLMQILDDQNKSPLTTFDYIRRFAQFVTDHRGVNFDAGITERELAPELTLHVIEPPCGSNTYILEHEEELLFVDGGYACYKEEMLQILKSRFPGFDQRKKTGIITHVDMDHTGLTSICDTVWMSRNSYENFSMEAGEEGGYREQNPKHRPYFLLSEIITQYTVPEMTHFAVVGGRTDDALLSFIGSIEYAGRRFDFYEGPGGHVKGEVVIVCEELKLLFSGDIWVNVKGVTAEQREFNRLAPFLLTGVDEDPALSKASREYLVSHFGGYLYCPGHGPITPVGKG